MLCASALVAKAREAHRRRRGQGRSQQGAAEADGRAAKSLKYSGLVCHGRLGFCYTPRHGMVDPIVVPRSQHTLSRRDIDPDALKVLYRLHQGDFLAYLVGGSVRDLLLGRTPKDFDIGTSAHPYQVKRLFRNCWIIGRRFRLAHVKFGTKAIEVATFRRQVPAGSEAEPPLEHGSCRSPRPGDAAGAAARVGRTRAGRVAQARTPTPRQHLRHGRGGRVPP